MDGAIELDPIPCEGCKQPESCETNGCFAAKARSVSFGRVPGTGRIQTLKSVPEPDQPSWEKGLAGERRPGGGFMPYLNDEGSPMGIKEGGERRHEIAQIRDRQRNSGL